MSKTFSVMTYNVHSSIGLDGKVSPLRIAEIINRCNPDIVALQELDAGLTRTAMAHQARIIANTLNMSYHFHSSIRLEAGEYGNAVLSRFPLRLIRAAPLPAEPYDEALERRGVVWVEVDTGFATVQVLATHFGLNSGERRAQTEAILGREWLGHAACRPPVLLCGDFNTTPWSWVYRRITKQLLDAQTLLTGLRPCCTWPVHLPFMRIDHLFLSPDMRVLEVSVPRTPMTRIASDHYPLMATLELP